MRLSSALLLLAFLPLAAADRFPVPAPPADLAAPPPGAATTASGLASLVLRLGRGEAHPAPDALVTVEFTLWNQEGKVLDTTAARERPLTRPMGRLLKGMVEGLQLMTAGEKRRLWLPQALTFQNAANRPAGLLVLEVELLAFEPSPYLAPPDVAGPSGQAVLLSSGLAMRVLREGQGTAHPGHNAQVTVHYSGWTIDGRLFDTSWRTSEPSTFRLGEVIPGWTEGLKLMVPGEKARFWVPQKLAYQGERGKPAGMLVFDIELLEFNK